MGFTYTELRPVGNTNKNWFKVCCSANGQYVYVGDYHSAGATGRLYFSDDYGASWIKRNPTGYDVGFNVAGLDCSADGARVVVGSFNNESVPIGRVYYSSNFGASFIELQPFGDVKLQYYGLSMSSNGGLILFSAFNNRVKKSLLPFSVFTELTPAGAVNKYWYINALDEDGSVMFTGVNVSDTDTSHLWLSTNEGTNWTNKTQMTGRTGQQADMSDDGNKLVFTQYIAAGAQTYRAYYSSDSGVNISEVKPRGVETTGDFYRGCAISGDGVRMVLTENAGRIFTSEDNGVSFDELRPAGDLNKPWRGVGVSSNGNIIYIASLERLWKCEAESTTIYYQSCPAISTNVIALGTMSGFLRTLASIGTGTAQMGFTKALQQALTIISTIGAELSRSLSLRQFLALTGNLTANLYKGMSRTLSFAMVSTSNLLKRNSFLQNLSASTNATLNLITRSYHFVALSVVSIFASSIVIRKIKEKFYTLAMKARSFITKAGKGNYTIKESDKSHTITKDEL